MTKKDKRTQGFVLAGGDDRPQRTQVLDPTHMVYGAKNEELESIATHHLTPFARKCLGLVTFPDGKRA